MGKVVRGTPNSAKRDVVPAAPEDILLETRSVLPADPDDPRLTVEGAQLCADGKINTAAYEDLQPWYGGEPAPDQHPYPERPGVRAGEQVAKGLRIWDDLRAGATQNGTQRTGAGWICTRQQRNESKREKWFNIRTCGSWRLAFVLARLQQEVWEKQFAEDASQGSAPLQALAPGDAPEVPAGATSASSSAKKGASSAKKGASTPQKTRPVNLRKRPSSDRTAAGAAQKRSALG